MKNKFAKLMTFILVTILPFISVDLVSYGENNVNTKDITYSDYLEMNIENHETEYNENLEKKLNANGITDEMIERIPKEFVEKISENNGNIGVELNYYKCVEMPDNISQEMLNDNNINKNNTIIVDGEEYEQVNLVELSDEELDELINYEYKKDVNSESCGSMFQQKAYAASLNKLEDEVKSESGMLYMYSMITYGQTTESGLKTVYIYSEAEWLISPKNRGEDVFGIEFHYDTLVDDSSIVRKYSYIENDHSNPGIITKTERNVATSSLPVNSEGNAFYVKFNLEDDKSYSYITDNIISLSGCATVINTSLKATSANTYYWHKTRNISRSTSVQLGLTIDKYGNPTMEISVYETFQKTTQLNKISVSPEVHIEFK